MLRFRDRADAGRRLGEQLKPLGLEDPVVLGLPRGGVPVAAEVAAALEAPLEVFVARKIGAPGHAEFGIGAVAEGDAVVSNDHALRALHLSPNEFDALVAHERDEVERRVRQYRGSRSLPEMEGRDVVLVDDGLATGVTAEAALRALRARRPRRLVLAAPACAAETAERLRGVADEVTCVATPRNFYAVGQCYDDFTQTGDEEVIALLDRAASSGGVHLNLGGLE